MTLLPLIERSGLATAKEIGIETLEDRLRQEAAAASARLVPALFASAADLR